MAITLKKNQMGKNFKNFNSFIIESFFVSILLLTTSCVQSKNFSHGIEQINKLNSKYNTTMETYPDNVNKINAMLKDLEELKKIKLAEGQEPFNYIVDYRILNLEAEKLYIYGQKYGVAGTTKQGFGCKSRPLIIESSSLRNQSALKGFEAINLLREFIAKYPKESALVAMSEKNALFLNATFYQIAKEAKGDSGIINHFCPENTTLELYQQEFRKKTNLSEEFINNLGYGEASAIWKKERGIE